MNNKSSYSSHKEIADFDLSAAVRDFVDRGGVIARIPDGGTAESAATPQPPEGVGTDADAERSGKLELLKELVAKGAGVSALQYALKMNRKEIRQLAVKNGITITFSRPLKSDRKNALGNLNEVDDVVAGHAMHYSSLGYTVPEIAQILGVTIRQVWDIGKAYRFEFRQIQERDIP